MVNSKFVRKFCIPLESNHNIKESLSAEGEYLKGYEMTAHTAAHAHGCFFFTVGGNAPEVKWTKAQPAHTTGEPHRPPTKGSIKNRMDMKK